ncbi:uncharacterized protein V2V93DRAFT_373426 [Kockiozyma suomiensis]|uniref:uncharacterized protein n=1 Tax=Kockiozyma suomiensis TaxID=1337062 RepID=UPI0033435CD8
MQFAIAFVISAFFSLVASQAHGETGAQEMGPMAFLWPPDRDWSDDSDNTAPCGSVIGVRNRTEFPLEDGSVALVMQDSAWNIEVAIYYGSEDPVSISQFTDLLPEVASLEAGHQCYSIEDQPSNVTAGSNATLEIRYTAVDDSVNATQYACADITFVTVKAFNYTIPCFNVSYSDYANAAASSSISSALSSLTSASSAAYKSDHSTASATATSSAATSEVSAESSTAASASSTGDAVANYVRTSSVIGPLAALIAFLI